jgi:hypothetical protein
MLDMANENLANLATLKNGVLPTLRSACNPASAPNSVFVRKMGFFVSTTVTGPEDAPRFVAERVAEGPDYLKILVTGPAWSCAADAGGCICCCASGPRAAAALGGLPGRRGV